MPIIASNTTVLPLFDRVYKQAPNCAPPAERQENFARIGLTERQDDRGRTRVFRFATAEDPRPLKLAENLRNVGSIWKEWDEGINNCKPAKLWKPHERASSSKFSRRKPIYLLLDRLVNVMGKLPAEAFRLVELYFPSKNMGVVADSIRKLELEGNMPTALCHPHHKLDLQPPKKRRRRNR